MKRFAFFLAVFLLVAPVSWAKRGYLLKEKFKEKNEKILVKKWSRHLKKGTPKKRYYPEISNPARLGEQIFVGTQGGFFYAVDAQTGKVLWKYENEEPLATTPAFYADKIYFTDLGGRVICLSQHSGELLWQQGFDREILSRPLVDAGKIYFLKGENEVTALSADNGHFLFSRMIRTFIREMTMRGHGDLVKDGQFLYVGLADGHLYKLSADNGKVLWDKNLSVSMSTFKDIDARVVIDGDALYVGGYFGRVYRLHKGSGNILWSSEVGTGVPVLLMEDLVVVSDQNGTVHALDKESGSLRWSNELDGAVLSAPVRFADHVFLTSLEQKAYVLDAATGNRVQRLSLTGGAITTPAVAGDDLVVLTSSGMLVSLKKNAGR